MQSSNHRIPRWYAGFTFFYIGNIYCSWWWLWRCRWEWQWFKDISVTILISCDLEVAGAAAGVLASVDVSQKNDEQKKHRGKNWETTQSKIKRPILIRWYLLANSQQVQSALYNCQSGRWEYPVRMTLITSTYHNLFINRGSDLRIDAMIQITCTYLCHIIV